ncbi:MAG: hypothetical protein U9R79_00355 [Armatimonadota bacterium]|nr:hypothetical protein [Armatimonadota bacterium]
MKTCTGLRTVRDRLGRVCRARGLLLLPWALGGLQGCSRPEGDAEAVTFLYSLEEYDSAEGAVSGQVRNRLDEQGIEFRGLWLDLRPADDGPPELTADIDADCRPEEAEEVSRVVAEVCLKALPRHEQVQVRVFRWYAGAGGGFPRLAGTWVWDGGGQIISHTRPRDLEE